MEKVGLKYGIFTALGLIAYFLLMKLMGLERVVELRFLNGIIMAIGVCLAIRGYKKRMFGKIGYFKGLGTGLITTVVASVIFAAFIIFFVKAFDTQLLTVLSSSGMFGERMAVTPGIVIFVVLMLEGVISGGMISFIAMQYFKKRDYKVPGSP
jgi:hypothetical protein